MSRQCCRVMLHVHTCSGRNLTIPLMRQPITYSPANKPITLPHNQLLMRYVVMSPIHTVTIQCYAMRYRYKCGPTLIQECTPSNLDILIILHGNMILWEFALHSSFQECINNAARKLCVREQRYNITTNVSSHLQQWPTSGKIVLPAMITQTQHEITEKTPLYIHLTLLSVAITSA